MEDLENIRTKLIPFLPASIQAYNSVVLAMSDACVPPCPLPILSDRLTK